MVGKEKIKVGDVFITNQGCRCVVVEYINNRNVTVEFETGNRKKCEAGQLRDGRVKNIMLPSVCGVGYTGTEDSIGHLKSYFVWWNMLQRCYDDKCQTKHPTYIGCSVSEEWHNFNNFRKWFDIHYVNGYELDKDFKKKDNKIYSPSTCLFIPQKLNNLLINVKTSNKSGFVGVCYDSQKKKYKSYIAVEGKSKFLGRFTTPEEAYQAYITAFNQKLEEYKEEYVEFAEYLDQHKLGGCNEI